MTALKRRLNRIDALAVSLGAVVGVGVFFSTSKVLRGTDSFLIATAVWLVVGIVNLTGAILCADLSARIPEAGGPYAYVRVAFGRPAAFVYGWLSAGIAIPVRQAATYAAIGVALARWLPGGPRLLAVLALLGLTGLNLAGVRAGAIAQRVFTTGKLLTLGFVIVLATVLGATGSTEPAPLIESVSFATAVSAAWYTYLGWQDIVLLAEELYEPRRDIPVVLVATVALTMLLYIAIHIAVYVGLGGGAEAYGETPAITIASRMLGTFGAGVLSALMVSSMLGGAAEGLMVRPRIAMAMARDHMGPTLIAAVNRSGTPYGALLFHVTITLALVASNSFTQMLPLVGFSQGLLGVFETASYFAVRRKLPALPTSRFHPWAPLVFLFASAALCILAGLDDLTTTALALGLIGVFSLVYAIARPRAAPDATGSP
ncbi:MAG TPA: amino acid permease [Kofleriaceae bacterium]|jgi:APA family basic amino acid/polyamine antiporter|nr:amino acid permease [Kofleriaceae bacterium]